VEPQTLTTNGTCNKVGQFTPAVSVPVTGEMGKWGNGGTTQFHLCHGLSHVIICNLFAQVQAGGDSVVGNANQLFQLPPLSCLVEEVLSYGCYCS